MTMNNSQLVGVRQRVATWRLACVVATAVMALGASGCLTTTLVATRATDSSAVLKVGVIAAPLVDGAAIAAIGLSEDGFDSADGLAKPGAIVLGIDAVVGVAGWLLWLWVDAQCDDSDEC
jgi:hypothetical protein